MASGESNTSTAGGVGTHTSPAGSQATPVEVEIRGQTLSIRSDHDPEFVHRLAEYIDGKVASLQQAAPTVPMSKLLMLASMTVAEELFEAREHIESLEDEIGQRTNTMLDLLDDVIAGPPAGLDTSESDGRTASILNE